MIKAVESFLGCCILVSDDEDCRKPDFQFNNMVAVSYNSDAVEMALSSVPAEVPLMVLFDESTTGAAIMGAVVGIFLRHAESRKVHLVFCGKKPIGNWAVFDALEWSTMAGRKFSIESVLAFGLTWNEANENCAPQRSAGDGAQIPADWLGQLGMTEHWCTTFPCHSTEFHFKFLRGEERCGPMMHVHNTQFAVRRSIHHRLVSVLLQAVNTRASPQILTMSSRLRLDTGPAREASTYTFNKTTMSSSFVLVPSALDNAEADAFCALYSTANPELHAEFKKVQQQMLISNSNDNASRHICHFPLTLTRRRFAPFSEIASEIEVKTAARDRPALFWWSAYARDNRVTLTQVRRFPALSCIFLSADRAHLRIIHPKLAEDVLATLFTEGVFSSLSALTKNILEYWSEHPVGHCAQYKSVVQEIVLLRRSCEFSPLLMEIMRQESVDAAVMLVDWIVSSQQFSDTLFAEHLKLLLYRTRYAAARDARNSGKQETAIELGKVALTTLDGFATRVRNSFA